MPTERREICQSCRHFDGTGLCRRHPPTMIAGQSIWPKVYTSDWCGDHDYDLSGRNSD